MQQIKNKYSCQKSKAKHRGIDFELTFEEWWNIWQQSGKWEQRGCRKGQYVMSRNNDTGPYAVGNVFIQLAQDNHSQIVFSDKTIKKFSEQRKGKPKSIEWKNKISLANLGKKKPQQIIECSHCKKYGALNNMKRWHFDNCKEKI